ncbi:hypothetical protein N7475_009720 [Penicillium sp. IBT 31633x]|nr:hypothetical protein N7475_009720 [Penicillium sp. IBT 31633x]
MTQSVHRGFHASQRMTSVLMLSQGLRCVGARQLCCILIPSDPQYVQEPLGTRREDVVGVSESQEDREVERMIAATGELTCCISCRYFGFRSELMVNGGSPTRAEYWRFGDSDNSLHWY